jgi:hypothetical protein
LLSLRAQSFVFPSFLYNMKVKIYGTLVLRIVFDGIVVRRYYRSKVLNEYINLTLYVLNLLNKTDIVRKISLLLATPTRSSFSKPSSRRLSQEENINYRPNTLCTDFFLLLKVFIAQNFSVQTYTWIQEFLKCSQ